MRSIVTVTAPKNTAPNTTCRAKTSTPTKVMPIRTTDTRSEERIDAADTARQRATADADPTTAEKQEFLANGGDRFASRAP